MTNPASIDLGEELLGLVGIGHSLSHSKKPIMVYQQTERLADAVDETARAFVNGEKPTGLAPHAPIDYDQISDWLVDSRPQDMSTLSAIPHEIVSAYVAACARAKDYLKGVFPRETITTMTSTRSVRPSALKIAKFRRIYTVADGVRSVFRSLLDGTLTRDQAAAFQILFPTTFKALKMAILGEIASKLGADPAWTLSYARDQLFQSVTMTSIDNPGAMKRLQQNFQAAKDEAAAAAPASKPTQTAQSLSATQTPVQRASK